MKKRQKLLCDEQWELIKPWLPEPQSPQLFFLGCGAFSTVRERKQVDWARTAAIDLPETFIFATADDG